MITAKRGNVALICHVTVLLGAALVSGSPNVKRRMKECLNTVVEPE